MPYNVDRLSKQQVDDIAHYFATRRSLEIKFADADLADYLLYLIEQKWQKEHGDTFTETFPYMAELWNILSDWRVGERKTIEERAEIIRLAKCHLKHKG